MPVGVAGYIGISCREGDADQIKCNGIGRILGYFGGISENSFTVLKDCKMTGVNWLTFYHS